MNKLTMVMLFSLMMAAFPLCVHAYVGAGLGVAYTDVEHTSSKVFAGFSFIPDFGLEIAYNDFGNYRGERADAYSLAGIVTVPVDNTWDLFAKFGATENHTKFALATSHGDMLTGIGFVYKATREVSLRFEYENFGKLMNEGSANNSEVTNWGLNLKSTF